MCGGFFCLFFCCFCRLISITFWTKMLLMLIESSSKMQQISGCVRCCLALLIFILICMTWQAWQISDRFRKMITGTRAVILLTLLTYGYQRCILFCQFERTKDFCQMDTPYIDKWPENCTSINCYTSIRKQFANNVTGEESWFHYLEQVTKIRKK
jgi:hypothetical protein